MIMPKDLSKNIAEAIRRSGLTQTEIANRVGVSISAVNKYKMGKSLPSVETFSALCKALDLDANEILCVNEVLK